MGWNKEKYGTPWCFVLTCGRDSGREDILKSLKEIKDERDMSLQEIIWEALFEYTQKHKKWSEEL